MRKTLMTAAAFVLTLSASALQAQTARPGPGADADARRAWMKEHRAELKAKWETLTPEQRATYKADMKAYEEERKSLMEQVKSGKIDKKTAGAQLKAWREEHKKP